MKETTKAKIWPCVMGAAIIAADQSSKAAIVSVAGAKEGILWTFWNNLLWIVHQRNTGAAFSFLDNLGPVARVIGLGIVPLLALAAILVYYFRTKDLSRLQEWALVGAVSGGLGNLIDRFFRYPLGVVDFISVKFPGPWGDRWPTFNIADSALVVCCIILIVSFLVQPKRENPSGAGQAK